MGAVEIAILMPIVVSLTTLLKWFGLRDKLGAAVVLAIAAALVALWVYSKASYERQSLIDYVAAWIVLATASAGVFGYTRAGADAVTSLQVPPAGAAQNPTAKQ